uniref:H/ACA ribonucleoprotein complex subunit n=1 Tax=Encephalitozoon cuniculi TaxID=6035 RepID=M1JKP6_ENCCN|nr:small nucleolar protein [Encephalitozoon cuniculi]
MRGLSCRKTFPWIMARNFNNRKRLKSTETAELGKILYMCQGQLVIKLAAKDIPYPNSPVLDASSKIIGKVDEILGRIDDVHVTIKPDDQCSISKEGETLFSYADKFIPKKRFLPREETEKKKEEMDRIKPKPKKDQVSKGNRPRAFGGKQRGSDRKPDRKWGAIQSNWSKGGRKAESRKDHGSKRPDANRVKPRN